MCIFKTKNHLILSNEIKATSPFCKIEISRVNFFPSFNMIQTVFGGEIPSLTAFIVIFPVASVKGISIRLKYKGAGIPDINPSIH